MVPQHDIVLVVSNLAVPGCAEQRRRIWFPCSYAPIAESIVELAAVTHEDEARMAVCHALQAENWQPEYKPINRRAQLHACVLPPDQLNPAGYYDGSQTAMLKARPLTVWLLLGSTHHSAKRNVLRK